VTNVVVVDATPRELALLANFLSKDGPRILDEAAVKLPSSPNARIAFHPEDFNRVSTAAHLLFENAGIRQIRVRDAFLRRLQSAR
jgi:hypothetical protein